MIVVPNIMYDDNARLEFMLRCDVFHGLRENQCGGEIIRAHVCNWLPSLSNHVMQSGNGPLRGSLRRSLPGRGRP